MGGWETPVASTSQHDQNTHSKFSNHPRTFPALKLLLVLFLDGWKTPVASTPRPTLSHSEFSPNTLRTFPALKLLLVLFLGGWEVPTTSTSQVDKTRSKFSKPPPDLSSLKTFAGAFFGATVKCLPHPLRRLTKHARKFSNTLRTFPVLKLLLVLFLGRLGNAGGIHLPARPTYGARDGRQRKPAMAEF